MVKIQAANPGNRERRGRTVQKAVADPAVAGLIQAEQDADLVDRLADHYRGRHVEIWLAAYQGETFTAPTQKALLETLKAKGILPLDAPTVYVTPDGQRRVIW